MFEKASNGRPELHKSHDSNLRFNLSHCATRVNCVVCPEVDCGIDVESVQSRNHGSLLQDYCLSEREKRWLASGGADDADLRFIQLWTLKEAVAKAAGLGLQLPFEQLDFDMTNNPKLTSAPSVIGEGWLFEHHSCLDRHIESLALRKHPEHVFKIQRHEWSDLRLT